MSVSDAAVGVKRRAEAVPTSGVPPASVSSSVQLPPLAGAALVTAALQDEQQQRVGSLLLSAGSCLDRVSALAKEAEPAVGGRRAKRVRREDAHATDASGAPGSSSEDASLALTVADTAASMALIVPQPLGTRLTSLDAPTMALAGHAAPVLAADFHPSGKLLATASKDKRVLIWEASGECSATMALTGHKNAVTDCVWALDGVQLATSSADKTCSIWDTETGARVRTLIGHERVVNSISRAMGSASSTPLFASVSDDGTLKLWDGRTRQAAQSLPHTHAQLSVACGDDPNVVYTGGIDGVIRQWDVRRAAVSLMLPAHGDLITGLSVSPDGTQLLSFGADAVLCMWDIRAFVRADASRALRVCRFLDARACESVCESVCVRPGVTSRLRASIRTHLDAADIHWCKQQL